MAGLRAGHPRRDSDVRWACRWRAVAIPRHRPTSRRGWPATAMTVNWVVSSTAGRPHTAGVELAMTAEIGFRRSGRALGKHEIVLVDLVGVDPDELDAI